MLDKDYKEILQCLLDADVKFLLVGAYALAVHGFPRATKDIDFFVRADPQKPPAVLLPRISAPAMTRQGPLA